MAKCEHVKHANPKVQPSGDVCQGCVDAGLRWVECVSVWFADMLAAVIPHLAAMPTNTSKKPDIR